MKAFGNFRINTKPNFQSKGQAEQEGEGQIGPPTFQCSCIEMVLLFFFLLVCEFLSLVCPPEGTLTHKHVLIIKALYASNTYCVGK